jgi:hypothetical protein
MPVPSFDRELQWARYLERERILDEQAERQRQRAPEPEPEQQVVYCERASSAEQRWGDGSHATPAIVIVVLVCVILGLTISWWAFWIGLAVSFFVIGVDTAGSGR